MPPAASSIRQQKVSCFSLQGWFYDCPTPEPMKASARRCGGQKSGMHKELITVGCYLCCRQVHGQVILCYPRRLREGMSSGSTTIPTIHAGGGRRGRRAAEDKRRCCFTAAVDCSSSPIYLSLYYCYSHVNTLPSCATCHPGFPQVACSGGRTR